MKCSFCESALVCNVCHEPFRARSEETHVGLYQPDTAVSCPHCQSALVCKICGFSYAGDAEVSAEVPQHEQ